jgi:hypothetical protein
MSTWIKRFLAVLLATTIPVGYALADRIGFLVNGTYYLDFFGAGTGAFGAAPASDSFMVMKTDGTLTKTTSFDISLTDGYSLVGSSSNVAESIDPEVIAATSATLTAAQVRGNVINNYGQGAADNVQTCPTAAQGMGFVGVVGQDTASGDKFCFRAGTNDKIYLNGVAGSDNGYVCLTDPAIGNMITCFTFQVGASAFDWRCSTSDSWNTTGP